VKKIPNKTTATNGARLRLVNKKTGKLASSTNWLVDLAAEAKVLGDSSGISALLPHKKASKLLARNELKPFKIHKENPTTPGEETSHKDLRVLVKLAYPELALFYIQNVVQSHKPNQVNRKGFRAWLITELNTINGGLNRHLMSIPAFRPLIELNRSDDWWRKSLKTESKFKAKS
jgi:hypothetical protein